MSGITERIDSKNGRLAIGKINKFFKTLDNNYDINCGGCCYIAAVVAEILEQYNIKFKVVVYSDSSEPLRKDDLYICSQSHYAIYVKGMGIINKYRYLRFLKIHSFSNISSKTLYDMYDRLSWNHRYNPNYNNTIGDQIGHFFKKVLNNVLSV